MSAAVVIQFLSIIIAAVISIDLGELYSPAIVNGQPTTSEKYPFMVSLVYYFPDYDEEKSFCGGTLIDNSPPIVLTAAHCVQFWEQDDDGTIHAIGDEKEVWLFADIGRTYANSYVEGDDFDSLVIDDMRSMVYVHPNYNPKKLLDGNDIALIIFLNQDDDDLSFVHLPSKLASNQRCCSEGEEFTAIGYGHSETGGKPTETLQRTTLECIDNDNAAEMWADRGSDSDDSDSLDADDFETGNNIVCVIGDDTDICQGDSGGPIFKQSREETVVVGLVSFTVFGCNTETPSGYTSIAHHYDWIMDVLYNVVIKHNRSFPAKTESINETKTPPYNVEAPHDKATDKKGIYLISVFLPIIACLLSVNV